MISLSAQDDFSRASIVAADDAWRQARRYRLLMGRATRLLAGWARSPAADAALALALAVHSQLEIWAPGAALGGADAGGLKSVLVPTALLATLPLALRRRFPLAVICVVAGSLAAQAVLTDSLQGMSGLIAVVVAVYSVAAHAERARALVGLAVALVAGVTLIAEDPADFPFDAFVIGVPWLGGRALRTARLRARELEELTAELASEREERARLAVAAERSRIARELHDVVAHSVSTMVVQAEAGEALLDDDPKRARDAFASIQDTGREALAEMRRLLGLLRREDRELALVPQPSMARLENLLSRMQETGLVVEFEIEGAPRSLPPGLDLSAYRIVQEAVTNTLKHSGGARAAVTVRYCEDALELEIVDDGQFGRNDDSGGHGIAGMRERVRLFGGELDAGRHPGGGYAVRARLPLRE
jgi:signal transduction histidine kinase